MKYSYGVVRAIVQCDDCEWHTESYKNAQALAARHAKSHGHTVNGELGISFTYFGKEVAARGENGEEQKK